MHMMTLSGPFEIGVVLRLAKGLAAPTASISKLC